MKNTILFSSIIGLVLSLVITSCSDGDIDDPIYGELNKNMRLDKVCTNWGASMEQTIESMVGCVLVDRDENYLKFSDVDGSASISYSFSNNKLMAATLIAPKTVKINLRSFIKDFSYLGNLESKSIYYNSHNTMCIPYTRTINGVEDSIVGFAPITSDLYGKIDPIHVTTGKPTEVRTISAVIHGNVSGVEKSCTCGARISTYEDMRSCKTLTITSDGDFELSFTSLSAGTVYYYQCYAIVDDVEYTGETLSFKTIMNNSEGNKVFNVDGVIFTMILVEAGTFQMGSTTGASDEKPMHQVTLTKNFYMGESEVTQALWKAVMGYSPTSSGNSWTSSNGLGDNYPAYYISYEDAQSFIKKLNAKTGEQFRLPTEAEWEYAAKGGNLSEGYIYSGSNTIEDVAWYENTCAKMRPIKGKAANELGLYDMTGNVWEFCSDWYSSSYYSNSAVIDPTGPTTGSYRVRRGGSWKYGASSCRSTNRMSVSPTGRAGDDIGFRLAL